MDLEFKYWNKDNILDIIINKEYNEKILILEKFIGWYSNNLHINIDMFPLLNIFRVYDNLKSRINFDINDSITLLYTDMSLIYNDNIIENIGSLILLYKIIV
jgi:hypothetical protein